MSVDIKAVLAKHALYLRGDSLGKCADLRSADLAYANLAGADLADANLEGANLTGSDLADANLEGANLTGADLADANLEGANLTGADLAGSDLTDANLTGAKGLLIGTEVVVTRESLIDMDACERGLEVFDSYGVSSAIIDPRALWAIALGDGLATVADCAAWLCNRLGMGLPPGVSTATIGGAG